MTEFVSSPRKHSRSPRTPPRSSPDRNLTRAMAVLRLLRSCVLIMSLFGMGPLSNRSSFFFFFLLPPSLPPFLTYADRVQTAWALGQLLVPGHPLTDAFFAAEGVPLVCSLLITGGSPAAELRALGALLPLLAAAHTRAAVPSSVPRKVSLLLSSPQPPLRAHALQAVGLLIADKNTVPILLEGHGLSIALLAIIQPPLNNPLLLQALDLLRSLAEIPAHAAILVRAGLREALHPHLASTDSTVLKSANVLYNLLV